MSANNNIQTFPVLGMTCAACAVSVESVLKNTKGVIKAAVNIANQSANIEYDPSAVNKENLREAVQSIGYDLLTSEEDAMEIQDEEKARSYVKLKNRTLWSAILTLPVVIIGMFFMDMPGANWISFFLTAPVVFYFGGHYFVSAWKKLLHKTTNMDTLVALSTGIAFLFSLFNTLYPEFWHQRGLHAHVYYETAAVIIVFISIGKLLEERAKSHTSSALKKLMGLQPKTVRIRRGKNEFEVPVREVHPGDIVVVRPGEKVAVDGKVIDGASYVDESMLSGEPVPVAKVEDSKVFAGTINQKGTFSFKAEKTGGETLLSQIIKSVQNAQASKAPVQQLVDRIAAIFVPVVIGIAILTFISWMIFGGENSLTYGLLNAITVLVIACPCALGLATPTAIMVGIGKGAENNILIRDAESLEIAHKVNAIILDKTGTITEGKPKVASLQWQTGETEIYKNILFTIESRSEHPLASAVVEKLATEDVSLVGLTNYESVTGRGVKATYKGEDYFVGNGKFLAENNIDVTAAGEALDIQRKEARTVVLFAGRGTVLAVIAIEDAIKASSAAAILSLQHGGIEVFMLTGDNARTAEAVAKKLGIDNYEAEVMPAEKATFVKQLQSKGKIVAMVGDGINDSEALALADVSIAMGKGSDIAMDVAKMTLITSDLRAIPKALNLSGKIVTGIRQNLFWAFIYNLIGIPIAAGILYPVSGFLLNPMIAGAAMALSSVSVVTNSLRLKYARI
jgi:P-type Cu2+ transporter